MCTGENAPSNTITPRALVAVRLKLPVVESVHAVCKRVDREQITGDINEEIQSLIRQSVAAIVDLSGSKPNVLYEAGYARALGKPCVHICSTSLKKLPFDVRNINTLSYTIGRIHLLKPELTDLLKAALE